MEKLPPKKKGEGCFECGADHFVRDCPIRKEKAKEGKNEGLGNQKLELPNFAKRPTTT